MRGREGTRALSRWGAALAASAIALSACTSIGFEAQDVELARDVETDALELELVYHDVIKGNCLDRDALAAVRRMAAGERLFLIARLPLELDVDEWAADADAAEATDPERARRVRRFCEGVTVKEARVYVDAAGSLGIAQRVRVADASEAAALASAALREPLLDERDDDDLREALGEETLRRLRAEARAGVDWLRWSGTALELSLPLTEAGLERLRATTVAKAGDEPSDFDRAWIAVLSEAEIEGGRATWTFAPDADGVCRHTIGRRAGADYDDRLLERLRAEAFAFDEPPPR